MKVGIAGRLASSFINSKLTPLVMIAALLIGMFGTYLTPREEEPQILQEQCQVPSLPGSLPPRGQQGQAGLAEQRFAVLSSLVSLSAHSGACRCGSGDEEAETRARESSRLASSQIGGGLGRPPPLF